MSGAIASCSDDGGDDDDDYDENACQKPAGNSTRRKKKKCAKWNLFCLLLDIALVVIFFPFSD